MPPQHVDIGAQARERRAQLVAGVLDQPLLLLPGTGERRRASDRRRRPAARPRRRRPADRRVETARRLDVLGGGGQPAQWCRHAVGDPQADRRRDRRRRSSDSITCAPAELRSTRSVSSSERAPPAHPRGMPDRAHAVRRSPSTVTVSKHSASGRPATLGRSLASSSSTTALVERRLDHRSVRARAWPRTRRTAAVRRAARARAGRVDRRGSTSISERRPRPSTVAGQAIAGDADCHGCRTIVSAAITEGDLPAQAHGSSRAT